MVPGAQMIMAPGLGGYMQYPQIHPAAIGMAAGQMGQIQMGMQPLIIQPMAVRPSVSKKCSIKCLASRGLTLVLICLSEIFSLQSHQLLMCTSSVILRTSILNYWCKICLAD